MMGAVPVALAVAFIVEEGFGLQELARISRSLGRAAEAAGVKVVTGDTKVVGRGAADRLFITTTGLGVRMPLARPSAGRGGARGRAPGGRPRRPARPPHPAPPA